MGFAKPILAVAGMERSHGIFGIRVRSDLRRDICRVDQKLDRAAR